MKDNQLKSRKIKFYKSNMFPFLIIPLSVFIVGYIHYTPENSVRNICIIFIYLYLFLIVVTCFYLLSIDNYNLSNNGLIVSNFFNKAGRKYNINDIDTWLDVNIDVKNKNTEILYIYFKNGQRLKISEENYENYLEIKKVITNDKKRDYIKENLFKKKSEKGLGVFLLLFSFFIFFLIYTSIPKKIEIGDLKILKGEVTEKINYTARGKYSSLEIKIKKYPEFIFSVRGKELKVTKHDRLIKDVKVGDSIFLGLDKVLYRKFLLKVDSLSFCDKFFPSKYIGVESICTKQINYLKLSENNAKRLENKFLNTFVGFCIGLIFTVMSISCFKKYYN